MTILVGRTTSELLAIGPVEAGIRTPRRWEITVGGGAVHARGPLRDWVLASINSWCSNAYYYCMHVLYFSVI